MAVAKQPAKEPVITDQSLDYRAGYERGRSSRRTGQGRPPIQHHRLLLTLPDDWEDVADRVEKIVIIRAAGGALRGALSHPAGYLSVVGAIILAAHTIPGIREVVIGFEKTQAEAAGVAIETYVKSGWKSVTEGSAARTDEERQMYERWINDLWNGIKWAFRF